MSDSHFRIAGELAAWPTKTELAAILRAPGLRVFVGRHSVALQDCRRFVFQGLDFPGGATPSIDADSDSLARIMLNGTIVSHALAAANLRHRFEVYDGANNLVGYLHHDWPAERDGPT